MKPDLADPMAEMRLAVQAYLEALDWSGVPVMAGRRFRVEPLARGEYNLNYRLVAADLELVLRVNIGTQIGREDQIVYEYKALKLLQDSGYTPRPHFVDDSRRHIPRGVGIMEYLPGRPLDYRTDLEAAARLLAGIHQVAVAEGQNHLIRERDPLSLIYDECAGLLARYFTSDLADPDIRGFLGEVLAWADRARHRERYFQADPWPAIVNTEVNSGNFIVNPAQGTIHLVDWEMPRWGDPSTDLCHFCSPLTTLWKTDYRMLPADRQAFLAAYRAAIGDRHLRDTLAERVRLKDPFVHLRGISWSAMGWVAYQTDYAGIRNPDTWATLRRYMDLGFIRSLFEPLMVD
jgi:aminoglycoside phosphotransferase (APT) family kinase protein